MSPHAQAGTAPIATGSVQPETPEHAQGFYNHTRPVELLQTASKGRLSGIPQLEAPLRLPLQRAPCG